MSCIYCDRNRDMRGVVESAGCAVEEICIERVLCFSAARYVGDKFLINVTLPECYVMTVPINYCPMCGEPLGRKDEL